MPALAAKKAPSQLTSMGSRFSRSPQTRYGRANNRTPHVPANTTMAHASCATGEATADGKTWASAPVQFAICSRQKPVS